MFCPKCRSEYREGYTRCSNCNVDLVPELPKIENDEDSYSFEPVYIKYASNQIDAEMMMDILRSNNIPCFRKSKGAGGYLNIAAGFSVFGEEIYVDKKDYDAAAELLESFEFSTSDENEAEYSNKECPSTGKVHFTKKFRIIAIVSLALAAAAVLLSFVPQVLSLLK